MRGVRLAAMVLWLGGLASVSGAEQAPGAPEGKPTLVLETGGHTATVARVLFTPDVKQLITVSFDKTVRVWDLGTRVCRHVFHMPAAVNAQGELYAGALSPDGGTLAVAGFGYRVGDKNVTPVYLLDLREYKRARVLHGHAGAVHALTFSPDGARLASGGDDAQMRIWDVEKGTCVETLEGHSERVTDLAFCPTDGRRLASVSDDHTTRLWSLGSAKADKVLTQKAAGVDRPAPLLRVAWSPDGKVIATAGRDCATLQLWNADGSFRRHVPLTHAGQPRRWVAVPGLAFVDSNSVVVSAWDQYYRLVAVYDVAAGKETKLLVFTNYHHEDVPTHDVAVSVAFHDAAIGKETKLLAVSDDAQHRTWLWRTEAPPQVGPRHTPPLARIGGKGKDVTAAAWTADGSAIVWRSSPLQQKEEARPEPFYERSFDLKEWQVGTVQKGWKFSEATGVSGKHKVEGLDAASVRIKGGDKPVVAALPKGEAIRGWPYTSWTLVGERWLAVATNFKVYLFDTATGNLVRTYGGQGGDIRAVSPSPDDRYFLTVSGNQVIRIWDPANDRRSVQPLLSLFALDNEWIAWTPEGYYAASAGGERLMGWRFANGHEGMPSYYPASRFRKAFYRPDVITRLLKAGNLKKALAAADAERPGPPPPGPPEGEKVVEVAEVQPPRVTLRAPGRKDLKLTEPTLEVEARAEGDARHPVTSLQLMLDGRPWKGGEGVRHVKDASQPEKWLVEIPEGEHTLRVVARTDAAMGMSDDLEVVFARPVPRQKLHVLAMGINTYKDRSLAKLKCAVNDATELARTFQDRSKELFDVAPILLPEEKAGREGILKAFADLKGRMKPHDVAVVFYAGHGVQDAGGFYLLPQDVDMKDLQKTAISGEELKQQLADLPGKVLLLLDACHSGAIGRAISDIARDLSDEDCGVIVLCAALGSEKAGEQAGHGFFCQAILESLKGARNAPKNPRDGRVYEHHLEQYVIDRVGELSQDEQHPTAAKPTMKPLALAKP